MAIRQMDEKLALLKLCMYIAHSEASPPSLLLPFFLARVCFFACCLGCVVLACHMSHHHENELFG